VVRISNVRSCWATEISTVRRTYFRPNSLVDHTSRNTVQTIGTKMRDNGRVTDCGLVKPTVCKQRQTIETLTVKHATRSRTSRVGSYADQSWRPAPQLCRETMDRNVVGIAYLVATRRMTTTTGRSSCRCWVVDGETAETARPSRNAINRKKNKENGSTGWLVAGSTADRELSDRHLKFSSISLVVSVSKVVAVMGRGGTVGWHGID